MKFRIVFFALSLFIISACTSSKNTAGTRWYHAFNTRYNIYFNGNEAFKETYKNQIESYINTENYAEIIKFHPVSATPKDKKTSGGAYTKPVEKAVKAIKLHSIQTKPARDNNSRNSREYRAFMKRTEFNPFLHNAWTMLAKSQFYNGDFIEAASTFSFISRLYETQPEIATPAKIWKARCYNEMEWFYDAENILSKIDKSQLTKSQSDWYSTVYADYFVKQKRYEEAIPFMQTAVKAEKNKLQRNREKYLLAQIYAATGQKALSYKLFGEVGHATVPYILQLNANIRQTEVFPDEKNNIQKVSKKLKKMAKSSKNKEYLDMVYYALGNVYMTVPDTAKALESYTLGSEKSIRGGIDKAMNQIQLGDIYFTQREYIKAQPNYSEALGQLKKEDSAYPRVSKRSEALDALVIHAEAVELQDSLQRLAKLPEEEQLKIVDKIIADLKKKEKEEREKAEQEEYQAKRQEMQSARQTQSKQKQPAVVAPPSDGSFYFYNPQAVAAGKNVFQQKWGRRKLEDDWRRRTKSKLFDEPDNEESFAEQDSVGAVAPDADTISSDSTAEAQTLSDDPYDPQFYLQQIPATEEDMEASNLILQDGLFNMGVIFKDMLEDYNLAIQTLDSLNIRFPENENKLEAYHHIYLIYWKLNDMENALIYKNKIRTEFPESDLAIAMADPDYEYNQKMLGVMQDSLYRQAFEAYQDNQPKEIRKIYEEFTNKYTGSDLQPKFMFLNALSFAQTLDADTFKVLLKDLIDKYPNEDVSLLALDMMKGFQRGLLLASSGGSMLARGSIFNLRFGGDSLAIDTALAFSTELNVPHKLLLLYPKGSVNENIMLFNVANFNFSNFARSDFDLQIEEAGNIGMLQISGFASQDAVLQYYDMISGEDGYASQLEESVIIMPISDANFEILKRGKSMEEYMKFFEENFFEYNEDMIDTWHLKEEAEKEAKDDIVNVKEDIEPTGEEEEEDMEEMPFDDMEDDISQDLQPQKKDSGATEENEDSEEEDPEEDPFAKASESVEKLNEKIDEITSDPLQSIKKLFTRKKKNYIDQYAEEQEKAEKERLKQERKEKAKKDREKAKEKKEKEKEKAKAKKNKK
jgi:hypothetical protein